MKRKKAGQPFNEMKKRRRKKNDSHMAMKKESEFLNKKLFWYFKHFPAKEKKNCFRFWDFFFFWRKISNCSEIWYDLEFFGWELETIPKLMHFKTIHIYKIMSIKICFDLFLKIMHWYLNKRLYHVELKNYYICHYSCE